MMHDETPAPVPTRLRAAIIMFLFSAWLLLSLQGCGGSQTNPAAPTPATALAPSAAFRTAPSAPEDSARPAIANVAPSTPAADAAAQLLYVFGTALGEGVSVTIIAPGGTTTMLGGTALRYVSATGIIAMPVLDEVGRYRIVVTSPRGQSSEAFPFDVKAP